MHANAPFRVAVIGAGRMGKLHARVIGELPDAQLACVVDVNPQAANALAQQRNTLALTDPAAAVNLADAAIIAVPTPFHLQAARPFVQAGKHVLIEKPFTDDPDAAQELMDLAARTGAVIHVGHTERFNPAVLAIQNYAIRPKFIEAHRISPFTFRSAEIGVVLDMMIHDLDLVLKLAAGRVEHVHAVGVNVIGAHEDICNARLIFDNGCVANVTASRLAIKTERKMRLFSEDAYVSVDFAKKVGVVMRKQANLDLIQMARQYDAADLAELAQSVDYTKLLQIEQLPVDQGPDPLRRQAEAFRDSALRHLPPVVPAGDGLAAVRLAQQIIQCLRDYRWDRPSSSRRGLDIIDKTP